MCGVHVVRCSKVTDVLMYYARCLWQLAPGALTSGFYSVYLQLLIVYIHLLVWVGMEEIPFNVLS